MSQRSVEIIRQHRFCSDEDASVYAAVLESSGRKDKRSRIQLTHGFWSLGRKKSLSGSLQHPNTGHRYTGVTCGVPVLFYAHTCTHSKFLDGQGCGEEERKIRRNTKDHLIRRTLRNRSKDCHFFP